MIVDKWKTLKQRWNLSFFHPLYNLTAGRNPAEKDVKMMEIKKPKDRMQVDTYELQKLVHEQDESYGAIRAKLMTAALDDTLDAKKREMALFLLLDFESGIQAEYLMNHEVPLMEEEEGTRIPLSPFRA